MRRGFTLVELLVSVAVIGLLASFLLPAVQAAREAARVATCQSNLHQVGVYIHDRIAIKPVVPALDFRSNALAGLSCESQLEDDPQRLNDDYYQEWVGWKYVTLLDRFDGSSSTILIAWEGAPVHDDVIPALYLDSHVGSLAEMPSD